jgi:hypothetical protein
MRPSLLEESMKKQAKKLKLCKETISRLSERDLDVAVGATTGDYTCNNCATFTCNTCTSLDCATSNGPIACIC